MKNPYVLIASHQRVQITTENVRCCVKSGVGVILVVSEQTEADHFRKAFPSIIIVLADNAPLGGKWDAGVQMAKKIKADPLIINGSDDFLSNRFYIRGGGLLNKGYHFVGLRAWYVHYKNQVTLLHYQIPDFPLGGGRIYTRYALDAIDYSLFDTSRNKHLDGHGYDRIKAAGVKRVLLQEPRILSVKGDWACMTPADRLLVSKNCRVISIHYPHDVLPHFGLNNKLCAE